MANSIFSETLQTLRKEKGCTQGQLAEKLGVSAQAVSKWENGSYPDGDLIPKIAEYFGVSISALYGKAEGQVSIEQQVLDAMQQAAAGGTASETAMNILWAIQLSAWSDNHSYFPRTQAAANAALASVFRGEDSCCFMNLNPSQEFFTMLREPKGGFSVAENAGQLISVFRVLGEPGCMEVLLFLMSLRDREYVGVGTVAARTGLSEHQVRTALDHLCSGSGCVSCVQKVDLLNSDGRHEQVYGICSETSVLLLSVLLQLQTLLAPPRGWAVNISTRNSGLLNREKASEGTVR